jgi:hypothetical protein
MAAARDTDAANVKPLEGAVIQRFTAGAAIEAGEFVAMQSDGYVDPAIGTSVILGGVGIALPRNGGDPATAAGDVVDVVTFGPVVCMTGATIGALVIANDTAGEFDETGGTKDTVIGFAQSATVLFVRVQVKDFS